MPKYFTAAQIPDLTGKVALITGANTGIGFCSTSFLASAGVKVYLACRTEIRALDAIARIKAKNDKARIEFLKMDLTDLGSIRTAGAIVLNREKRLDILINNAGIMAVPYQLVDGVEIQFLSNHLGHFLLVNELLPLLRATAKETGDVRVVNLSSLAHAWTKDTMDYSSLESINMTYGTPNSRYGQSKAANILYTKKLQRFLDAEGDSGIYVNSPHPGFVNTELPRGLRASQGEFIYNTFISPFIKVGSAVGYILSPEDGAMSSMYCATSPQVKQKSVKGQYTVEYGAPKIPTAFCQDKDGLRAENLWKTSLSILESKGFTGLYA